MNAAYLSDDKDNLRGEPEPDGDLDGGALSKGGGVERSPYSDVGRRDNALSADLSVDIDREV